MVNDKLRADLVLHTPFLLACLLCSVSCRETPDQTTRKPLVATPAPARATQPASSTPSELVDFLREYHRLRQYHRIEDYVVADHRADLTRLLGAVDRLLAANRRVIQLIRKSCSPTLAAKWDLIGLADSLGIFSIQVTTIDTTYDGDRAVLHYQIGGTLPLRKAEFRRRDGRWLYLPDTAANLPECLEELASTLETLAAALERKPLTEREIDFEYRSRIVPVIERIEKNPSG